jgi:predicted nucleic acid-binding Zn ribbon protein
MDDPPPATCEVCGAKPLEKVLHPVPIFFKGKGFYSTDYGRKSRKRESGDGEVKADKKPDKTETKKTETPS